MRIPHGWRKLEVGETTASGDCLWHIQPIFHWAPLAPSYQGKVVGADWRTVIRLTASQEQPNDAHLARKPPECAGSEDTP